MPPPAPSAAHFPYPGVQPGAAPHAGLPQGAAPPLAAAAEQALLDFARRAARQGPMVALVLHLSTLRPPAPRPHHRRIARAMLNDVVQRQGGRVLGLSCGDLVLLCPPPPAASASASTAAGAAAMPAGATVAQPGSPPAGAPSVFELPAFLARLLHLDAPDPHRLVSLWPLPARAADLLAYATARSVALSRPPAPVEAPRRAPGPVVPGRAGPGVTGSGVTGPGTPGPGAAVQEPERDRASVDRAAQTVLLDALAAAAETADLAELLRRQIAVLLPSSAADRGTLQPLFREIAFSISMLESRVGNNGPARADPFLFRHLAARLDRRMLDTLSEARDTGRPLDPGGSGLPLHLNLGLAAILSPAFARFAGGHRGGGEMHGGVEVSLMEACADPAAFGEARARVRAAGMLLVLDRVSHLALGLAQIWPLQPDLVKLEWSQAIARLDPSESERLDVALAHIGPSRMLLLRADTELAVRWGMARGIRRFQGRHVDAMLAASRLATCAHAAGCTLRQCSERAEAAGEAGRRFCRNTRLLDAAAPGVAASHTWTREIA